jgi:hypothetical protein
MSTCIGKEESRKGSLDPTKVLTDSDEQVHRYTTVMGNCISKERDRVTIVMNNRHTTVMSKCIGKEESILICTEIILEVLHKTITVMSKCTHTRQ